jgi:hypothetical protein
LAALRRPELIRRVTPSAFAAAMAFSNRDRSLGDIPSVDSSSYGPFVLVVLVGFGFGFFFGGLVGLGVGVIVGSLTGPSLAMRRGFVSGAPAPPITGALSPGEPKPRKSAS